MADVIPWTGDESGSDSGSGSTDRGQLILVTGFALAVVFLGLVLLLNSAIYTENVATRATADDPKEAVEIREESFATIEGYIEQQNAMLADEDIEDIDAAELDDRVNENVDRWTRQAQDRAARQGQQLSIDADPIPASNVTTTWEDDQSDRFFTDNRTAAGNESWTVLEEANATRRFVVTIERGADEAFGSTDNTHVNASSPEAGLQIEIAEAGDPPETVSIYEREGTAEEEGDRYLNVSGANDGPECTVRLPEAGNVTIEIADGNGTLISNASAENRTTCEAPLWPEEIGQGDDHEISIANGDVAVGSFWLVTRGTPEDPVVVGEAEAIDDEIAPAVYGVDARLRYVTDEFAFETATRLVPGDPP